MTWEQAVHRVDTALYLAKHRGRDRAVGWQAWHAAPQTWPMLEADVPNALRQGLVLMSEQCRQAA